LILLKTYTSSLTFSERLDESVLTSVAEEAQAKQKATYKKRTNREAGSTDTT